MKTIFLKQNNGYNKESKIPSLRELLGGVR